MPFTRRTRTLATLLVATGAWLVCSAFRQDASAPAPAAVDHSVREKAAAEMMTAEGMKRWQESCIPGKQHQALARLIGKWDTETIISGMGGAPMKSAGTAEFSWLFDGRWMQQNWSGSMMGQPVKGHEVIGYDNFKRKYTTASVNTMDTILLTSEGGFDAAGTSLITYGLMDEPMTGENDKMVKYVTRFDGDDKFMFEIHDLTIGETDTKVIEVVYTRQK